MVLNDAGRMVERWYAELQNKYPDIRCDEFVCMPNHVHFIIVLVGGQTQSTDEQDGQTRRSAPTGDEYDGQTRRSAPTAGGQPATDEHAGQTRSVDGQTHRSAPTGDEYDGQARGSAPMAVGTVVQWFKTMTTNEYIRGVKQNGWPPFSGRLWQRNYWERIIRNDSELSRLWEYIRNNPAQWRSDELYG